MSDLDKKNLHAKVTAETHERWHDFAADQGVSVTALLESLAPPKLQPGEKPAGIWPPVIGFARKLDAERRRRNR